MIDEVTQMARVVAVEKISERYLLPALEQLLANFPFIIQGFHSDNGSEYINQHVAKLLEKLHVEFTVLSQIETRDGQNRQSLFSRHTYPASA